LDFLLYDDHGIQDRNGSEKMEVRLQGLTIADVAQEVGCSVATASRVLSASNYPVSADMRARILKAASSLGYADNLKQRMMVNSQNPYLGIIVPTFQNRSYLHSVSGIQQAAKSDGYTAFVLNSQRDPELERQQISSLINKKIGILMLLSVDDSPAALHHYLDMGGSACVLESNFPDHPDVLNAKVDRFEAGRIATEYLLSQGHKSIAYVSSPLKHYQTRRLTLDGCRFAIEKHALPFSFENIFTVNDEMDSETGLYEFEIGVSIAEKVFKHARHYTGVVCLNDMIALGLISGLKAAGAQVPQNISVIGIDDVTADQLMSPRLTTVNTHLKALAQRAAQRIIQISDDSGSIVHSPLTMKPELEIGESVRRIA
jgi:LacI family transcriptional regulator